MQKAIWDNIIQFEMKSQSWWYLDNSMIPSAGQPQFLFYQSIFQYINISVYKISQIIALGLNHNRTILILWSMEYGPRKMELNVRLLMSILALYDSKKDSIVKVTPSKCKTFVLILSKMFFSFRFILIKTCKLYLCILVKDCTCRRASCGFVFVGNITVDTSNHSNICAYRFVNITTCDIHWAVKSHILSNLIILLFKVCSLLPLV